MRVWFDGGSVLHYSAHVYVCIYHFNQQKTHWLNLSGSFQWNSFSQCKRMLLKNLTGLTSWAVSLSHAIHFEIFLYIYIYIYILCRFLINCIFIALSLKTTSYWVTRPSNMIDYQHWIIVWSISQKHFITI